MTLSLSEDPGRWNASNQMFLPLMLLFSHQWIDRKKYLWSFYLSVTVAFYYLNANAQYVGYSSLFCVVYIFLQNICAQGRISISNIIKSLCFALVPFVVSVGLISFHLLRHYELLKHSHREVAAASFITFLPIHNIIQAIYPEFYMSSINPILNDIPATFVKMAGSLIPKLKGLSYCPFAYVGIAPFIMALAIIFRRGKNFIEKFLIATILVVIGLLFFNPVLYPLILRIPLLNAFPFIGRLWTLYSFAMAVLATIAFDKMFEEETRKILSSIISVLWIVLSALILIRTLIWVSLMKFENAILTFLVSFFVNHKKHMGYSASNEFYMHRINDLFLFMKGWASPANLCILIPSIMLAVILLVCHSVIKVKISKKFFFACIVLVIITDAFYYVNGNIVSTMRELKPYVDETTWIQKQTSLDRVMPIQSQKNPMNPYNISTETILLPTETSLIYGVSTLEGHRSLMSDRYTRFVPLVTMAPLKDFRSGEYESINPQIADLMNIRYLITPKNRDFLPHYKLVHETSRCRIYESPSFFQRAFIVHEAENVVTSERALEKMKNDDIDFSKRTLLEDGKNKAGTLKEGSINSLDRVTIKQYSPNSVSVEANCEKGGYLVLSDAYFPGWKAWVDGAEEEILPANYFMRAIQLKPGMHQIKFVYFPRSFKIGLIISFATLLLSLIFIYIESRLYHAIKTKLGT